MELYFIRGVFEKEKKATTNTYIIDIVAVIHDCYLTAFISVLINCSKNNEDNKTKLPGEGVEGCN